MTPEEKRKRHAESVREWGKRHPEKLRENRQKSYLRNRDARLANMKAWAARNPEKVREIKQTHYIANREKIIQRAVEFNRTKRGLENRARWSRNRKETDLSYRLGCNLRCRIWWALNNQNAKKLIRTAELIGCPVSFLEKHVQDQFKPGMTWENYGEWHIDHVMPCARFDLTDPLQQKICFHFTNLQPLWAKENLSKGAR